MIKEREAIYGQLRIMIYDFEYKNDLLWDIEKDDC
jgi:hypothetical protein